MVGVFGYDARTPHAAAAVEGFRVCSSLITGLLFGLCAVVVAFYPLDRRSTHRMADELAESRERVGLQQAT